MQPQVKVSAEALWRMPAPLLQLFLLPSSLRRFARRYAASPAATITDVRR